MNVIEKKEFLEIYFTESNCMPLNLGSTQEIRANPERQAVFNILL